MKNKPMRGSFRAMKIGTGIAAATIMLAWASVGSLAQNGTVHRNVVNAASAPGAAQGP
jgi:hypothetical protein